MIRLWCCLSPSDRICNCARGLCQSLGWEEIFENCLGVCRARFDRGSDRTPKLGFVALQHLISIVEINLRRTAMVPSKNGRNCVISGADHRAEY